MANPFLGQILGSVLGGAMGGGGRGPLGGGGMGRMGGMGGMGGGGLGDLLGGMMGGGAGSMGMPMGRRGGMGGMGGMGGSRGMLLALMLPLAMQWVQRNGGIGNVLQRFQQKGYSREANSWVSTGDNAQIDPRAVGDVMGRDEISRLSQELGVGEDEVESGFAEILPEMVDHLSPQGEVPHHADHALGSGLAELQQALAQHQVQLR